MLPLAVWRAHTHRVTDHRRIMILLFTGALVVAGLFTLVPGADHAPGVFRDIIGGSGWLVPVSLMTVARSA